MLAWCVWMYERCPARNLRGRVTFVFVTTSTRCRIDATLRPANCPLRPLKKQAEGKHFSRDDETKAEVHWWDSDKWSIAGLNVSVSVANGCINWGFHKDFDICVEVRNTSLDVAYWTAYGSSLRQVIPGLRVRLTAGESDLHRAHFGSGVHTVSHQCLPVLFS
jgi:hypothetical protein